MTEVEQLRNELFRELRARERQFDNADPSDVNLRAEIMKHVRRCEAQLTELNGAEFLHHNNAAYRTWCRRTARG
jgi:hypothetical protein